MLKKEGSMFLKNESVLSKAACLCGRSTLVMSWALDCLIVSGSLQPYGQIARQAPLSMGFSRQEYWSGLPCPTLVYTAAN